MRFLAFQESVNQAVEEGPQVLQIYSSEGSSWHLQGWASHSDSSTRAGSVISESSEQVPGHCISLAMSKRPAE